MMGNEEEMVPLAKATYNLPAIGRLTMDACTMTLSTSVPLRVFDSMTMLPAITALLLLPSSRDTTGGLSTCEIEIDTLATDVWPVTPSVARNEKVLTMASGEGEYTSKAGRKRMP